MLVRQPPTVGASGHGEIGGRAGLARRPGGFTQPSATRGLGSARSLAPCLSDVGEQEAQEACEASPDGLLSFAIQISEEAGWFPAPLAGAGAQGQKE